jgi:hypothetical protein
MGRKHGFCDSCQENKDHRRVAGVFSLINLILLGIPSLFGISTWSCTHCRSRRVLLTRQREVNKKIPASSFRRVSHSARPNGGLKSPSPPKEKSHRSRLYSEKYRDGVVKRIVSGITSISEVRESLELPESDVVDWIKESFQRKEDRVEMLREALMIHQKEVPDFDVEQIIFDVKRSEAAKERSRVSESSLRSSSVELRSVDDRDSLRKAFNRLEPFVESTVPNEN